MNYEKEYIRLWNAAEQALENIDFERRFVNSLAALRVLKNAVDWGRDIPAFNQGNQPDAEIDAEKDKCTCYANSYCPVHGIY